MKRIRLIVLEFRMDVEYLLVVAEYQWVSRILDRITKAWFGYLAETK